MNIDYFEQLLRFIDHQRWKYKFLLTRETQLENDMGITGDDAVSFLLAYGKEFNVDISNFMAADYFKGEGVDILGGIIRMFTNKQEPQLKKLTLGDLEKGILAGRLDEGVINSLEQ